MSTDTRAVEDRASAIRVTALHAIPWGGRSFVKVETNHGVTGWGDVNNVDDVVACRLAESLGGLVVGENPTRVEHLWQRMYRAHRNLRGGGFMVHVISAIDMALWDIAGKLHGVPVYRLLGGPCRDTVWMYPSAKAVKVGPGGVQPFAGTPDQVEALLRRVRGARAEVGPDGAVMFDAHSQMPLPLVKQFGASLEPTDLLFLEEAWVPGNIDAMRKVRESVRVPLATGERDRTIWEAREILEAQVVDILQPDCGHGGGISQMKKIAAIAEAHFVPLAPHSTMTYLGMAASLHVTAAVPFFLIHEGYDGRTPDGLVHKTWTMDDAGHVSLPEGPGLGVEVDEAVLLSLSKRAAGTFRWPDNRHADGSVADY